MSVWCQLIMPALCCQCGIAYEVAVVQEKGLRGEEGQMQAHSKKRTVSKFPCTVHLSRFAEMPSS